MSNSAMVCYTKLSPNCSRPRNHAIDTITIHCTAGNKNNTAKQIADMFTLTDRGDSCNYAVGGDGSIALVVDEKDRSWCTSSGANDHRAVTIEVASNIPGTEVNEKAYAALINLVADICKRNGIKQLVWSTDKNSRVNHLNGCNMTVHRDYANKACPGEWLYSRHGKIAAEVNNRLTEEDEDMLSYEQWKEYQAKYEEEKKSQEPSDYSSEARSWAEGEGIIAGDETGAKMYKSPCTREHMVIFLYRLWKKVKAYIDGKVGQ